MIINKTKLLNNIMNYKMKIINLENKLKFNKILNNSNYSNKIS